MNRIAVVCLVATGLILGTFVLDSTFPRPPEQIDGWVLEVQPGGMLVCFGKTYDHDFDTVFAKCTRLQSLCPYNTRVSLLRTRGLFGIHEKYEVNGVYLNGPVGDEI